MLKIKQKRQLRAFNLLRYTEQAFYLFMGCTMLYFAISGLWTLIRVIVLWFNGSIV